MGRVKRSRVLRKGPALDGSWEWWPAQPASNEKPRGAVLDGQPRGYEITTGSGSVVELMPGVSVKALYVESGRPKRKASR